jgi:hypothetical protein
MRRNPRPAAASRSIWTVPELPHLLADHALVIWAVTVARHRAPAGGWAAGVSRRSPGSERTP